MDFLTNDPFYTFVNEMPDQPDHQSPVPSYPDKPGQTGPMNPKPHIPGTDAPEVSTGSRIDEDLPAEDTDENAPGDKDSEPA
ncbi:hypothetical protein [Dyadobacter sandarakinus]|uniref:Uncharacterized protein n=1 Tax=Dyadobacter sandarakinus TaxID=2747268 RepID=A0ABX7I2V2_9BACT|nr:hypothetical protein [Dyadobacter sandarakinus]QRR00416.1 hypothetical protein HWI92_05590 [Dyadobacter sandarakinus]